MQLYGKSSKNGPVISNLVCDFTFHPTVWGFEVKGGKEPVGFGLVEHFDKFFRITFLCWTLEIVRETFIDEDGIIGGE